MRLMLIQVNSEEKKMAFKCSTSYQGCVCSCWCLNVCASPWCLSQRVHVCVCVSYNSNEGSLRDYHSWALADLKVKGAQRRSRNSVFCVYVIVCMLLYMCTWVPVYVCIRFEHDTAEPQKAWWLIGWMVREGERESEPEKNWKGCERSRQVIYRALDLKKSSVHYKLLYTYFSED